MIAASLTDAQTRLDDLVARAEGGEDVVLEREGRPVVRLVAINAAVGSAPDQRERMFGALAGQFSSVSDEEWAEMDREIEAMFAESAERPLDPSADA